MFVKYVSLNLAKFLEVEWFCFRVACVAYWCSNFLMFTIYTMKKTNANIKSNLFVMFAIEYTVEKGNQPITIMINNNRKYDKEFVGFQSNL